MKKKVEETSKRSRKTKRSLAVFPIHCHAFDSSPKEWQVEG